MTDFNMTFQDALDDVSAASGGGAPFLMVYGITFLIVAISSLRLPEETVALMAIFQGAIALPIAFWLERRWSGRSMHPKNPLKSLSVYLAVSQGLAIPALIVVNSLNPRGIPVTLAAMVGMHFLPYAWLQRSKIYSILATGISIGAFMLQLWLGPLAFHVILFFVGVSYLAAAPLLYQNARRLTRHTSEESHATPLSSSI